MKENLNNYDWALPYVDNYLQAQGKKIELIAEIGSRDALDGIALAKKYKTDVMIFEPDPYNIPECKKNIQTCDIELKGRVELFETALFDKSKIINWYSIDPDKYDNPGASSMYMINFNNRRRGDPDKNRDSIQKKFEVEANRFDELNLKVPTLIAMDVQGAELAVLKGFGNLLKEVSVIILESSFSENYIGASKFEEVDSFLKENGFCFNRSSIVNQETKKPKASLLARLGFYTPDFNVLYVKNA